MLLEVLIASYRVLHALPKLFQLLFGEVTTHGDPPPEFFTVSFGDELFSPKIRRLSSGLAIRMIPSRTLKVAAFFETFPVTEVGPGTESHREPDQADSNKTCED